jgi:hypothetical protein
VERSENPGQIVPALTQPVIEPDADSGLMTLTSTDPEFGLAQARLSGQRVSDSWFGDLNRMREKMDAPLAGHQRLMVSSMLYHRGDVGRVRCLAVPGWTSARQPAFVTAGVARH